MAHKKAGGAARINKDSQAKRLGVKIGGGQVCLAGNIIVRQKGNKYFPGKNVLQGNDFTLYAVKGGIVKFSEKRLRKYDGKIKRNTIVSIEIKKKIKKTIIKK